MSTTFETMKSSVEGLIKRELLIFDLVQIKTLCPDLIKLAYVDLDSLDIALDGQRSNEPVDQEKEKYNSDRNLFRKKGKGREEPQVDIYEQAMNDIQSGGGLHLPGRRSFGSSGAYNPDSMNNSGLGIGSSSSHGGGWRDDAEDETDENQERTFWMNSDQSVQAEITKVRDEHVLLFEFNDGTVMGGPKARRPNRPRMMRGPNRNEKK